MLKLKYEDQALVLWIDKWSSKVIGLSKKLIENGYGDNGDDLDDWDLRGESPTTPGLYVYEVWFGPNAYEDFWLTKPVAIFHFTSEKGLLSE